jgi:hypothetical protein
LLKAIAKNPAGAAKLRAVLAIDVYRDRMKDAAKAVAMAREFLAKSPAEDGWTEEIVRFLYDSATGDDAFRQELERVAASARAFPQLAGFQDRVWNPAPSDKNRHRDWQAAKKKHQEDPVARLWRQTREDGGKSGQACQELLQKNPSPGNRKLLLARLAYVYRHHLGGKSKEVSAKHYETLCKELPGDLDAASRWLEASFLADRDMQLAAARHVLGLPPADCPPDTWVRLCETKDEAILRKAIPWITASSKENEYPLYHSARIGDLMNELGMKSEAVAWWRSRMDLDPGDSEAAACALRVAGTMEPAQAVAFLKTRFDADTGPPGRLRRRDRQPRVPRLGLRRDGGDPFQIRRPQRRLAFRIVRHGRMAGPRLVGGGPQRKGMAGRQEGPRVPHRARFETRPPERRGRHRTAGR